MEILISRLGIILAVLIILWIIGMDIIELVMWIKCFKVTGCSDRKCPVKNMCYKYQERMTEEDYQRILKKIEEMK